VDDDARLPRLTLRQQAALLREGECSSRELVEACLARIERLDGKLHAFVTVFGEEARHLADAADHARRSGLPLGALHGIPVALKDLLEMEGRITTMGSQMWRGRISSTTATVVERLLAAGMIPIGKTHMVEFAFGAWGTNPLMGAPWNPWDAQVHRAPGGSSSGSAVAVAAGLVGAAIGSDTGGSVRVPAAFTGITGLKVTYGRVSLHGAALLSWTLDTIGPMARTVDDCAMLLDVIAGPDPRDPATLQLPPLQSAALDHLPQTLRGTRIAIPPSDQLPGWTQHAVIGAWHNLAASLQALGADVIEVRLPDWFFDLAAKVGGVIIATEALAQHTDWIESQHNPIGEGVRTRILNGRKVTAADYARTLRQMGERRVAFLVWFEPFDALLLPTVGVVAPAVADIEEQAPIPGYLTRPVNYLGLCALSLPAGSHEGLPIGMQLIGKPYDEARILRIGRACEQTIGWTCAPPVS